MVDFRTPRGYQKVDWPFQTRFTDGTTPSYFVKPAIFLPVWAVDKVQDDPVVIPPGTFIGRLNATDHSDLYALDPAFVGNDDLAPASPIAYIITYGSNDLADAVDTGSGTPDIDVDSTTYVAAAGDATETVNPVKPCGMAFRPYYAGWIKSRYENYDPHLLQTWISGNHIVRIPAMTAGEFDVQPGDLVQLNDGAGQKWNPGALLTSLPGRVEPYDGTYNVEFIVGRCVNKHRIARQAAYSSGQKLLTAIGTAAPRTLTNINTTTTYLWPTGENYQVQSKVEGVPGMQLSATSATLGRPSELLWAMPDTNGDYWALDILLRV
jgi:hypothetical protein